MQSKTDMITCLYIVYIYETCNVCLISNPLITLIMTSCDFRHCKNQSLDLTLRPMEF